MQHPIVITSKGALTTFLTLKQRLAASMVAPIRTSLDYQGIARRAIAIPPPVIITSKGVVTVQKSISYDRDIDVSACIKAERVKFPLFEIFSNPTISLTEPKKFDHDIIVVNSSGKIGNSNSPGIGRRRFSVIDRAVQKARQDIMNQEDDAIFAALDAASGNKDI